MNKLTKKYYKQTKAKIPTSYPNKKDILNQIQSSLIQYEAEHSEFTYDDLTRNFGNPSEFADSLIEFDSPEGIRKKLYNSKKITFIVIGIIVFIIVCTIFILKYSDSYMTTQIITIEEDVSSTSEQTP